jgi:hypothetical protein
VAGVATGYIHKGVVKKITPEKEGRKICLLNSEKVPGASTINFKSKKVNQIKNLQMD